MNQCRLIVDLLLQIIILLYICQISIYENVTESTKSQVKFIGTKQKTLNMHPTVQNPSENKKERENKQIRFSESRFLSPIYYTIANQALRKPQRIERSTEKNTPPKCHKSLIYINSHLARIFFFKLPPKKKKAKKKKAVANP